MARARSIKPGFFHDCDLLALPPLARLIFAGLWTIADRSGRLKDKPAQIKLDILPVDQCDMNEMLEKLAQAKFIIRYEIDGQRFIQIRTWCEHQNPHKDERHSIIPAPCNNSASTVQTPKSHSASSPQVSENKEHRANTVQAPYKHGANRADSLNPVPLTLNPQPSSSSSGAPALPDVFDWFREVYPETVSNSLPARRHFERRINTPERILALQEHLPQWLETRKFRDGFAGKWQTFLDSEVWLYAPKPAELQNWAKSNLQKIMDSK
jgi:hypothetical protein